MLSAGIYLLCLEIHVQPPELIMLLWQDMERNHQMTCPICMKSYANLQPLWQRLDNEIALMPMPDDYATWQVRDPLL